MKRLLKYLWAWAWFHSRLLTFYLWLRDRGSGCGRAAILMFHRVIPEGFEDKICSVPEIVVTETSFKAQLDFLAEHYKVISLDDLSLALREKRPFPARTAVITFDDGWEDNYHYAWPLLKKYNLPAIIFLTTGFIGTRFLFWQERTLFLVGRLLSEPKLLQECFKASGLEALHSVLDDLISGRNQGAARFSILRELLEKGETVIGEVTTRMLAALKNPALPVEDNSFLSWEQVSEMNGTLVAFGSHGISHRLLDRQDDEIVDAELRKSRELLESRLHGPVRLFAYPNGNYNGNVIDQLREAGYEAAVTTEKGLNITADDPYRLKRLNICESSFRSPRGRFSRELFAVHLAGLL